MIRFRHVTRHGRYYRVCDPRWQDCSDPSFSKRYGGRWNPPGEFGALYLCRTLAVAAANARENFALEIHSLYDLKPQFRPIIIEFTIPSTPARTFVDAVSDEGLVALGLPETYPLARNDAVSHGTCRSIGRAAYARAERGIACRSAAEAQRGPWPGEELALFDRSVGIARTGRKRAFSDWYPAAS
ncbi:MAG: RES family NAD+ phosphorylase [Candidatus Eremiobacteraeota bacterium]|nr:RES family NAD+ phosphorylase [Candidatus Eremiobacteraeota bacterium]